jgi:hypothetical protein
MHSWLSNTIRLVRLYFAIELVFGLWGLAGACAVFIGGWNQNLMLGVVIAGGFLTSLAVWSYLSGRATGPFLQTGAIGESTANADSPKATKPADFGTFKNLNPLTEYALIFAALALVCLMSYEIIGR